MDGEGWQGRLWSFVASVLTLGQVSPAEVREWWTRHRTGEVDVHLSDPLITGRLLAREINGATTLRIDDNDWPAIPVGHGHTVPFEFYFKGVRLEPIKAVDGSHCRVPAEPSDREVVAGAFLAAVTDSTMRRQPSWVFVVREDSVLRLLVRSAYTGQALTVHGTAPGRR